MSSYKDLKKFKVIFDRDDFSFISDQRNIVAVSEIIQVHVRFLDGKEETYRQILIRFLQNLVSFYQWLNCKEIIKINEGYTAIQTEVVRAVNLLQEPEVKRKSISKGYLRKFKDNFLNGLTVFLVGIRTLFDPEYTSSTGINREQIIKYILDNVEGLGKRFIFNIQGNHAFANKVTMLNRQELLIVLRLLVRPSTNQIRTYNGWIDLGINASPVRILLTSPKMFGKKKVYYVFKVNEHIEYSAKLSILPENCTFNAA